MQQQLKIHGIECFAFHGCLEEEAKIGGRFLVDLDLSMDLSKAIESDNLEDTADYVVLHKIVREEMAIRSKLIEHVAGRIIKQLKKLYPLAFSISVSITKFNPPVNGQLGSATIVITSGKD